MECTDVRTLVPARLGAAGRTCIVEFWTTRCARCPDALREMHALGERAPLGVDVVACALSTGREGEVEMVRELTEELPALKHLFMDLDQKEVAKGSFGFTSVPHGVVLANGVLLASGPPGDSTVKAHVRRLVGVV